MRRMFGRWIRCQHPVPAAVGELDRYAVTAMSATRLSIGLLMFFFVGLGFSSSMDDLASPLQETRDAAAKILRNTWVAPSRTNWDSLLATIKVGMPKTNVMELLQPLKVTTGPGGASGAAHWEGCRLDDLWMLECSYHSDDVLFARRLYEQLRNVWVWPATNFTGIWTTYYVNGQRQSEIHYKDGRYFGEFTGFRSDGTKAYVQHYGSQGAEGEDTGYFPSGRVMYKGLYRQGKQVGTWVWYNEDGSTNSVRDYSKP